MFYQKLSIAGFGPHSNKKTYDFPCGVVFITGENGSGKSTIFDAIQWCLFGPQGSSRTLKDRQSVINTNRNTATVEVLFSHEDVGDVTVHRSLSRAGKHQLSVNVDGQDIGGGVKNNQEYIEDILGGLKHDVFSSIYMMQSSPLMPPTSFIGANASQRRMILSHIADPHGEFQSANKVVRAALRDAKKDIAKLESSLDTTQEFYDTVVIPQLPEILPGEYDDMIAVAERKQQGEEYQRQKSHHRGVHRFTQQVAQWNAELGDVSQRISQVKDAIKTSKKKMSSAQASLKETRYHLGVARAQKDVAEYIISGNKETIAANNKYSTELSLAIKKLRFVDDMFSAHQDGTCPVCGGDYSGSSDHSSEISQYSSENIIIGQHSDYLEEENYELSSYGKDIERLERQFLHHRESVSTLHDEIDRCEGELDDLITRRDILIGDIEDGKLRIASYKDNITDDGETVDVDQLYRDKIRAEATLNAIEEKKAEKKKLVKKIEEITEKIDWENKRRIQLENLKEQTSPDGALSGDITQLMDNISDHATNMYREFFDGSNDIIMSDGSEDGVKTCVLSCGDRDVATFSHGEQLRIYACIQAAFTTTVFDKTGLWIPMMWDEPSLATDAGVVAQIFSLPAHVTPEYHQSFVITREDIDDADYEHIFDLTTT